MTETTIQEALRDLTTLFKAASDTPHLDAEILITHLTGLSRTALLTHSEQILSESQARQLSALAQRRVLGEPIAYLTGHKEFWTMDLIVTPDVLIPRPETECLIEWLLTYYPPYPPLQVADLGVGSGAIALAIATERPLWTIHATDRSESALKIAQLNAEKQGLTQIQFFLGNWCEALPSTEYDLIVSNPPYVAKQDCHLDHFKYEPAEALLAGEDGLEAIRILIQQAKHYLKRSGLLLFEHGSQQSEAVRNALEAAGYKTIQHHPDLAGLPRFTTAYV